MKLVNEINYMNPVSGSIASGAEWMDDQKELGSEGGFPLKDLETLVPNQMEEIALAFIGRHKNHNLQDWFIENNSLLGVYANLIAGVFGEITIFSEKYPNDMFLEISSNDSISGKPIIFEFECANEEGFDPDVIEAALAHIGKNEIRNAYI